MAAILNFKKFYSQFVAYSMLCPYVKIRPLEIKYVEIIFELTSGIFLNFLYYQNKFDYTKKNHFFTLLYYFLPTKDLVNK